MKILNSNQFKEMLISAANNLSNYKQEIDALNVFPVPDGDTGTNMTLTISSGVKAISEKEYTKISEVAKDFSRGLLMGARGNSGVILSQIFRGLSNGLKDFENVDAQEFCYALLDARDVAYKAVMKPVEGTILTVVRETSEALSTQVSVDDDFVTALEKAMVEAEKSLENTPNLLPVLKEAGVVDSGGFGLVRVFEGMLAYVNGSPIDILSKQEVFDSAGVDVEHSEFGYCTEYILQLDEAKAKKNNFKEETLKLALSKIGDSIVVVNDEDLVKVHVHTLVPGRALDLGQLYGEFLTLKIENMQEQHQEIIGHSAEVEKAPKEMAMIAVCAGSGIADLFREQGCDYVIEGGQTMNPSTEDFANAINELKAKNVIILPNNSNIIMAAEQTVALFDDVNIKVVPTKTIPQGLSSSLMYSDQNSLEENFEDMIDIIDEVKTGEVTYAVRKTTMNGVDINEGDYIAITGKEIVKATTDRFECVKALLETTVDEDNEILTVLVGTTEDVSDEELAQFEEYVEAEYPELDADFIRGNQPVYSYIIGVE
jgi:DAK2 domain fusion protein YloV